MFFYLLSNLTLSEISIKNPYEWMKNFKNDYTQIFSNPDYMGTFLELFLFQHIPYIRDYVLVPNSTFTAFQHLLQFSEDKNQGDRINNMLNEVKKCLNQYYNPFNLLFENTLTQKEMIIKINEIFKNNEIFLKILSDTMKKNNQMDSSVFELFFNLGEKLKKYKSISLDLRSFNLYTVNVEIKVEAIKEEEIIQEITQILQQDFNLKVLETKTTDNKRVLEFKTEKDNEIINIIFIKGDAPFFMGNKSLGYFISCDFSNKIIVQHELGHLFQKHYQPEILKSIYGETLTIIMEQVSMRESVKRFEKSDIHSYFTMNYLFHHLLKGEDILPHLKEFLSNENEYSQLFEDKNENQLESFLKNITICYFCFIENLQNQTYLLGLFLSEYYLEHNTERYTIDNFKQFYTQKNSLEGWLKFLGVSLPDFTDWVFQRFFIKDKINKFKLNKIFSF